MGELMTWGFELGRIYNRRKDIHERLGGGSRQSGIITFKKQPLVIAITGDSGRKHGYVDRTRQDGVFEYFGAGPNGPMEFKRGNRAIQRHLIDGKDLLVFKNLPSGHRYEGQFVCEGHHIERALGSDQQMRDAIVFELRSLQAVVEAIDAAPAAPLADLAALKSRAFAAANPAPASSQRLRTIVERSRDVRDYVVARSGGDCEGCASRAPFLRPDGVPYLEPHHIRRLGDGGPDDPRFVIALCPNCHRRIHSGADGSTYNKQMLARMKAIER